MEADGPRDVHRHSRWGRPTGAASTDESSLGVEPSARGETTDRLHTAGRRPWWMLDAVKSHQRAMPAAHADGLADVILVDHSGQPVRLGDLWRDRPAVIVWLRQFGCPFCRAHAVQLNAARRGFEDAGAQLVLVGQGTSSDAAAFKHRMDIDLTMLADASRASYLLAGTKLATLDELIGPVVVVKAAVAMARRHVTIGHNTADEAQLGGTMVVAPGGGIPWAHLSEDASDMASPADILAALGTISIGRRR